MLGAPSPTEAYQTPPGNGSSEISVTSLYPKKKLDLRGLLDFNSEAVIAQSFDETGCGFLSVVAVKVVAAEVSVIDVITENVVSGGEYGARDGHDCFLGSTAALDPAKLCG